MRPHIVFTDRRQQRQPNHNTCLLTDDNDNPIIIRPHIVFTDGRQQQPNHSIRLHIVFTDERQPSHNTTTYCVY